LVAGLSVGIAAAPAVAAAPAPGSPAPVTTSAPAHSVASPAGARPPVHSLHSGPREGPLAASPGAAEAASVWSAGGIGATTVLTVPIALGGLVAVFMVVQWLIDRRDPRLAEAPTLREENSVGFE
jgi:hypothetical protein